jgi:hypothetical protein
MGEPYARFSFLKKQNIFAAHLDRRDQIDRACEISFLAHAISPAD